MFSSAALQIIAIVCMILDHVGFYLLGNFWLLRIIGRIAMPLFVFGLVQGFIHTSSKLKYFLRIAVFALVTELPLYLLSVSNGTALTYHHNILFNFILGFLAMLLVSKSPYLVILTPILAGIGAYLRLDYGWAVVILATLFFFVVKNLKRGSCAYYACLLISLMSVSITLAIEHRWVTQTYALLASAPLIFYNGEKGRRLPKILSYSVYPGHFLLILVVRLLLLS